jgi:DNA-binding protein HU-beta
MIYSESINKQKVFIMKRSDIIRTIQVQFKNMRASDATTMLDAVMNEMKSSIAKDKRIEIRGFGTFQPRKRSAKNGYNPTTGETMTLPAGKTILFKPSRELTQKMNG